MPQLDIDLFDDFLFFVFVSFLFGFGDTKPFVSLLAVVSVSNYFFFSIIMFFNFKNIVKKIMSFSPIYIFFLMYFDLYCEAQLNIGVAKPWQIGFQLPATSIMKGIISFHDDLFIFLTLILFFVMYILFICLSNFSEKNKKQLTIKMIHHSKLEIIWTIIPAIILVIIAVPSFSLLYSLDEILESVYTIKIIGHQWYWSFELVENEGFVNLLNQLSSRDNFVSTTGESFDSYMISEDEIMERNDLLSKYRLLTVDNHLFIPTEMPSRLLVSSADVLHSWAVPSLGIKVDACPGRLNQTSLFIRRKGLYYGQCSEICGVNHGFMPIGIYSYDIGYTHSTFILTKELLSSMDPLLASLSSFEL